MPQDQLGGLYVNLGKTRYNLKQYPQAIAAFERRSSWTRTMRRSSRFAQARSVGGNPNDAVATSAAIAQQSVGRRSARGHVQAGDRLRTNQNWRLRRAQPPVGERLSASRRTEGDAIRIYRNLNNVDDAGDARPASAARAAKALNSESDYDRYAYAALTRAIPAKPGGARGGDCRQGGRSEQVSVQGDDSAGQCEVRGRGREPRAPRPRASALRPRRRQLPPATCSTATASMPRPPALSGRWPSRR